LLHALREKGAASAHVLAHIGEKNLARRTVTPLITLESFACAQVEKMPHRVEVIYHGDPMSATNLDGGYSKTITDSYCEKVPISLIKSFTIRDGAHR